MLLWAGFASAALAQTNSACVTTNGCADDDTNIVYSTNLLTYPMISDQYAGAIQAGQRQAGRVMRFRPYQLHYGATLGFALQQHQ